MSEMDVVCDGGVLVARGYRDGLCPGEDMLCQVGTGRRSESE